MPRRTVEDLRGVGRVTLEDTVVVLEHVPYHIIITQPVHEATDVVAGARHVAGWLDIQAHDAAPLIGLGPLTLHLEDGRTMKFVLKDRDGLVEHVAGGTL